MSVYFYCLAISVLFWVLTVYSKDYLVFYYLPVQYANIPKDKVIASKLPEQVKLQVKGSGFDLLGHELFNKIHPITIDLSRSQSLGNGKEYFLDTRQSMDTVSKQLGDKLQVVKIYPENFGYKVKEKVFAKVPVKLNALLSYAQQYQLNGKITLNPEFVEISGDSAEVAQVKEIETESIMLRNLNKPVSEMVELKMPETYKSVSTTIDKVRLIVPVEKFTESSILTTISTDNLPRGVTVKTFPEKAKITYQVAISRYKDISQDMFLVRADYLQAKKDKSNKLKLQLVKTPGFVRNARVSPEKVEFILKRY